MKQDWTPAETATALQMRARGHRYTVIAARFDRTPHAVKRHLQYRQEQSA